MDKKSARKSDSSEKESDDADRSSDPTQEEEATDSQSEEPDSPAGNVRKAGGSGAVQASAVGGTPSGQKAQSHSSGEGYVNYERGSDPGALSARYGMDVRDAEAGKLQRLEREFGSDRVNRWAEEGMTVDTMGKPRDMRAFRERESEGPGAASGSTAGVQAKLEVSSPDDPAEREAERVAEQVVQMNTGPDQPQSQKESKTVISPSASVSASSSGEMSEDVESTVRSGIQGGGKPLPADTKAELESKMGTDFSGVSVHTGPAADEAARSINAKAYTMGSNIAFASGQYNPGSTDGKQLLAHELTHVTQQQGGVARATKVIHRQEIPEELPEETLDMGEFEDSTHMGTEGNQEQQVHNYNLKIIDDVFEDLAPYLANQDIQDHYTTINIIEVVQQGLAEGIGAMKGGYDYSDYQPLILQLCEKKYPDLKPRLYLLASIEQSNDWGPYIAPVIESGFGFAQQSGDMDIEGPFSYEMSVLDIGGSYGLAQGGVFGVGIKYTGNAHGTESWEQKYGGGYGGMGAGVGLSDVFSDIADVDVGGNESDANFDTDNYWAPENFIGRLSLQTIATIKVFGGYELGFGNLYGDGTYPPISFDSGGPSFGVQLGLEGPGTKEAYISYQEEAEDPNEVGLSEARDMFGEYQFEDELQVYFKVDEAEILPGFQNALSSFIQMYRQAFNTGQYEMELTGHASPTGPRGEEERKEYNMNLSEERVNTVSEYLMGQLDPSCQQFWPECVIDEVTMLPEAEGEARGEGDADVEPGTESTRERRVDISLNGSLFSKLSVEEVDGQELVALGSELL